MIANNDNDKLIWVQIYFCIVAALLNITAGELNKWQGKMSIEGRAL